MKTIILYFFLLPLPVFAKSTSIGVLEFTETISFGKPFSETAVRYVFTKDKDWKVWDGNKVSAATWKVTFDSKTKGSIETLAGEPDPSGALMGIVKIKTPDKNIPKVGKVTKEFGTWSYAEAHRPLILTTGKFNGDPEIWKVYKPSEKEYANVFREFRKKQPTITNCDDDGTGKNPNRKFKDSELKFQKSFKSKNDWKIISFSFREPECYGAGMDEFDTKTFSISPEGKIQELKSGLTLVDAGDYDGDGKTELIFQVLRYNRGGYIIYYDDFKQSQDFVFGYH